MDSIRKEYDELLKSFEAWKCSFEKCENLLKSQENKKDVKILKSNIDSSEKVIKRDQEWNERMASFRKNLHNYKNHRIAKKYGTNPNF